MFVTVTGDTPWQDIHDLRHRYASDPAFDPSFDVILDLTGVAETSMPSSHVADLAQSSVLRPVSRRALVVRSDSQFGLARMFQMQRDLAGAVPDHVRIFRTMTDAARWLDGEEG